MRTCRKNWKLVAIVAGALIFLAPFALWLSLFLRLTPIAETNTRRLYDKLVAQDYNGIANENLAKGPYFDVLNARDRVLGPIKKYEIVSAVPSPLVIPISIRVKTYRDAGTYTEWARIHSESGLPVFVDMDLTGDEMVKVRAAQGERREP